MEKCVEMLRSAMQNGELVEAYSNPEDTDRCAVGYVIAMDEDSVILRNIHPSGCEDGYTWYRTERIYRTNIRTRYMRCLEMLMDKDFQPEYLPEGDESLAARLLRFAMEHELVTQIELNDSDNWDLTGLVTETGEGVTAALLSDEGEEDGIAAIRLEDITEICCGDDREKKIGRLYRMRRNSK